jgi:hypothetical protein
MSYTTSADRFDFWTRVGLGEVGDPLRVVPGIGLHKISERALDSILERIRPDQGRSIALFSETEFMKGLELRQSLRSWGRK